METIRETEDFKSSDKRRKRFYAHKSVLVRLNLRTLTSVNIYFIKMSHATKGDQAISDSETNSLNTVLKMCRSLSKYCSRKLCQSISKYKE